jgi:glyoxylase-like metal-dependent hydrolase (beta-lactamase superfamily II)
VSPVVRLAPAVASVLAPNPGPMTLGGTNTWVVGDPTLGPVAVVDPGPDDEAHLARVVDVAGGRVATVLLTHRHLDHSQSAATFASRAGVGVRAADPSWRVGPDGLDDGAVLEVAGARLEIVVTPGHTSDSVSLLVTHGEPAERSVDLLTGDTVLGFGSTVITHPDGDLGAYLDSLDRLLAVVEERGVGRILPGHGPVVDEPAAVLRASRQHRLARLAQVRDALEAGASTPEEVLAVVYPDAVGSPIERAATQSVRAQLDHLEAHRSR